MRYYVIYEHGEQNWSAYPPDLPGVAVTAPTRDKARELVREAIVLHLEGLREDGQPVPEPSGDFVDVA